MTLSNSSSLTSLSLSYMRRDAGVVDQDVDAAELAVDVLDERVDLVPVADVARAGGSLCALGAQRGRDLLAGVGLAADDHDLGAGLRERPRHGEPEAARAAGDDRHAPGEVEAVHGIGLARRGEGVSWLVQDGHLLGRVCVVLVVAASAKDASAVGTAVVGDALLDAPGVQQQVEVPEHLPDDEQRLLGDRPRRPQARRRSRRRSRGRSRSTSTMRSQRRSCSASRVRTSSACAVTSSPCPVSSRASGIAAVSRRLSRYSTRARGRVPSGSTAG